MKTAVDQLIEKMSLEDVCKYSNELAEAKEMEKEQRKKDFRAGWHGNKHKDWNCEFYLQGHLTNQFKQQEQ